MVNINEVRKEVLNDIILDFQKEAMEKRNGIPLTQQENDNIMTLGLALTEFFSPIVYKIRKIKTNRPNFIARRIMFSKLAYNRFQALVNKKLISDPTRCLELPYAQSDRVSDDIYCKIIGDLGESP